MDQMNIFEFATPEWLWLLCAVPAIYIVYGIMALYSRRKLSKMGNISTLKELIPNRSKARELIKLTILALAVALLALAAARPQTGAKLRSVETEGREIMLVVDVSNSMLAEDVTPSRMERTRYAISRLIENMQYDHIGIVAFAEDAEVVLPITSDYVMARSMVRRLSPEYIANQGTNIGRALEVAMLSFTSNTEESRSRVVILITDGEAHDEDTASIIEEAEREGVMICCIGIGTPEGTTLTVDGQIITDENGNMVVTKLGETLLQQLAEGTEGVYTRAQNNAFGLEEIVEELDSLEATSLTERTFEEYDEQYQWFLAGAILLLAIESFILTRRNPLLRNVRLFEDNDNKQ